MQYGETKWNCTKEKKSWILFFNGMCLSKYISAIVWYNCRSVWVFSDGLLCLFVGRSVCEWPLSSTNGPCGIWRINNCCWFVNAKVLPFSKCNGVCVCGECRLESAVDLSVGVRDCVRLFVYLLHPPSKWTLKFMKKKSNKDKCWYLSVLTDK